MAIKAGLCQALFADRVAPRPESNGSHLELSSDSFPAGLEEETPRYSYKLAQMWLDIKRSKGAVQVYLVFLFVIM